MKRSKRPDGYYWAKHRSLGWIIIERAISCWWGCGCEMEFNDNEFETITNKPIINPYEVKDETVK